ncbi:hypothetical protein EV356DRAFT_496746 [Viridothelium virens]|uniref:Uncharacterized protein n=1 Tax=Viridothelium virens TaxID=1048519 RepID=A0A6A6HI91_VIRVR|nr:hypothetical protein EV356DRAFT_496746 [Viridothelium virens]
MTDCPPPIHGSSSNGQDTFFDHSFCVQAGDPRAYIIDCGEQTMAAAGQGVYHTQTRVSCAQTEACVIVGNPEDPVNPEQVAMCVPLYPETALMQAQEAGDVRRARSILDGAGPSNMGANGGNLALTLTGQHDNVLFKVSSIAVAPRDKNYNYLTGSVSCQICSRLTFVKSPSNTDNFGINITLPNANDIAILHNFSWTTQSVDAYLKLQPRFEFIKRSICLYTIKKLSLLSDLSLAWLWWSREPAA